jgi:hypothetical protein
VAWCDLAYPRDGVQHSRLSLVWVTGLDRRARPLKAQQRLTASVDLLDGHHSFNSGGQQSQRRMKW